MILKGKEYKGQSWRMGLYFSFERKEPRYEGFFFFVVFLFAHHRYYLGVNK